MWLRLRIVRSMEVVPVAGNDGKGNEFSVTRCTGAMLASARTVVVRTMGVCPAEKRVDRPDWPVLPRDFRCLTVVHAVPSRGARDIPAGDLVRIQGFLAMACFLRFHGLPQSAAPRISGGD
jgi:hypothetical protein